MVREGAGGALSADSQPARVSVLVRTRNGGERLRAVVRAVLAQRPPVHEVVLLDSGSADGVAESLAGGPVRVVHYAVPFTHPGSSNAAARAAGGDVLVFLSQDALPLDDGCLHRLSAAVQDPGTAAAFARQLPARNAPILESADLARSYPAAGQSPVVLSNVCSALPRALWKQHPFDERLPLAEDLEWGEWARSQGLSVRYEPRARVEHSHHYDAAGLSHRYRAEGAALALLGRAPFAGSSPVRAWLRGLPGDLFRVLAAGRPGQLPEAAVYHLRQYRALAEGAAGGAAEAW